MFKELSNPETRKDTIVEFIVNKAVQGLSTYVKKREYDLAKFKENEQAKPSLLTQASATAKAETVTQDFGGAGLEGSQDVGVINRIEETEAEVSAEIESRREQATQAHAILEKSLAAKRQELEPLTAVIAEAVVKKATLTAELENNSKADKKGRKSPTESQKEELGKATKLLEDLRGKEKELQGQVEDLQEQVRVAAAKIETITTELLEYVQLCEAQRSGKSAMTTTSQAKPAIEELKQSVPAPAMTFSSTAYMFANSARSAVYGVVVSAITGIRAAELTAEKVGLAKKLHGKLTPIIKLPSYSVKTSVAVVDQYCKALDAEIGLTRQEENILLNIKYGTGPGTFDARLNVLTCLLKVLRGEKAEQCVVSPAVLDMMHKALMYDAQLNDPQQQLTADTRKRLTFTTNLFREYFVLVLDGIYSQFNCGEVPVLPSAARELLKIEIEKSLNELLKINSLEIDEQTKTDNMNSIIGNLEEKVKYRQALLENDRVNMPNFAANALAGLGVPITTRNLFLDDLLDFLVASGPAKVEPVRFSFSFSFFGNKA